jgi:hypothetical protein
MYFMITFMIAVSLAVGCCNQPPDLKETQNSQEVQTSDKSEFAKDVIGLEWPLRETTVSPGDFINSYIETAAESGKKSAGFFGQDNRNYYIVWFLLDKKEVLLLHCKISDLPNPFPSAEIREKRRKNLPARPSSQPAFKSEILNMLIKQRSIKKIQY